MKISIFLILFKFSYILKLVQADMGLRYNLNSKECQNMISKRRRLYQKDEQSIPDTTESVRELIVADVLDSLAKSYYIESVEYRYNKTTAKRFLQGLTPDNIRVISKDATENDHFKLNEFSFNFSKHGRILDNFQGLYKFKYLKNVEVEVISTQNKIFEKLAKSHFSKHPCIDWVEMIDVQQSPTDVNILENPLESRSKHKARSTRGQSTPKDTHFDKQWSFDTLNVINAWDSYFPSDRIKPRLGIMDLGCNINHPDLKNAYYKNPGEICDNGIDDDRNGYIDDCYGYNFYDKNADVTDNYNHGTLSVGVVAATIDNNFGIAGLTKAEFVCTKIGEKGFLLDAFAEAVNYLISFNVSAIQYSGAGAYSRIQDVAVQKALKRGIVFVFPAGNGSCDLSETKCNVNAYPGILDYQQIISVAALDEKNEVASYSNWGNTAIDILAPGNIFSTNGNENEELFVGGAGTSYAVPSAIALVAYIWGRFPDLTSMEIVNIVRESSKVTPAIKNKSIYGVLDFQQALQTASLYYQAKLTQPYNIKS